MPDNTQGQVSETATQDALELRVRELEAVVSDLIDRQNHLPLTVFDLMRQLMESAVDAHSPKIEPPAPAPIERKGTYSYVEVGEEESVNADTMMLRLGADGEPELGVLEHNEFVRKALPGVAPDELKVWLAAQNATTGQVFHINVYLTPDEA